MLNAPGCEAKKAKPNSEGAIFNEGDPIRLCSNAVQTNLWIYFQNVLRLVSREAPVSSFLFRTHVGEGC